MKLILITLSLILSTTAFASELYEVKTQVNIIEANQTICLNKKENQNTVGMQLCVSDALENFDVLLNKEYKQIVASQSGEYKARLVDAQRAWIKYKESNCSWHGSSMLGGTGENGATMSCLATMTKDRALELVEFYQVH